MVPRSLLLLSMTLGTLWPIPVTGRETVAFDGDPKRRVAGRTVDEWRNVMKSLELASPAAEQAVPGLVVLMQDTQIPEQTRAQAAYTLGRIGAPAREAIGPLRSLLTSAETAAAGTRRWAAKALALFGPLAAEATPQLVELARNVEEPLLTRLAAIEALGRIGGAHREAIPTLIGLVAAADSNDPSQSFEGYQVRAAAIDSLAMVGPAAGAAVPTLIRSTRDPAGDIRKRSAAALGAIGTAAGVATESLVDLVLFEELPEVREAAATALASTGDGGQAALRQLLTDQEPSVRQLAAKSLSDVPELTGESRQTLVATLSDANIDVRLEAAEALHAHRHDGNALLSTLLSALTEPERQPRIRAYRLLVAMPTVTSQALPRLQELLEDERPYVRQVVRKLIAELEDS